MWMYRSTFFLISALVGGEWSASRSGRFTPRERASDTHWIGGWVNPRADLNVLEKRKFLTLPGLELRPLCRPAGSPSLYRLRFHGSCVWDKVLLFASFNWLISQWFFQTHTYIFVNKFVVFFPSFIVCFFPSLSPLFYILFVPSPHYFF
jgi:hypothetical protein